MAARSCLLAKKLCAGRRVSVIIREVEVRDPQVERAPDDGSLGIERAVVAEVVPQPERDHRQVYTAAPRAPVLHRVVPLRRRKVGHADHARRRRAETRASFGTSLSAPAAYEQLEHVFGGPPALLPGDCEDGNERQEGNEQAAAWPG